MPASTSPTIAGLPAEKLIAAALSSTPVSSPAFAWVPPAAEEIAPWFPDYEVQALAGRGAMGAVYRAVQRKLSRPVAIKLLPAELAAREGVEARFEREARALAQLNHPGIVALHDYGRTDGGHLFIVMEYVDGTDLSRLLHTEGGGLTVEHALEIVGQVCDALQYAHSRGFVHRDIKPGNVLVDKDGRVKIADFGLAKLNVGVPPSGGSGSEDRLKAGLQLTLTGQALGTPDYTAPEQLKGGPVDHRADIYSLGVMLYEMLTGELPRGAWPPPSTCTAAPARLDEVVTRAMQNEPDKRYQQASEVKAAAIASPLPAQAARGYSAVNRVMIWLMFAFILATAFITPTGDMITLLLFAAPFLILGIYFKMLRKPAGLISVVLAGMAMGAAIVFGVLHFGEEIRFTKRNARREDAGQISEQQATRIREAEAKLSALLVDYGEKHPKVLAARAELEALRGEGGQAQSASSAAVTEMQDACDDYDKCLETLIRDLAGSSLLTPQEMESRSRDFARMEGKRRGALALGMGEGHPLAIEAQRRLDELKRLDTEWVEKSTRAAGLIAAQKQKVEECRQRMVEFGRSHGIVTDGTADGPLGPSDSASVTSVENFLRLRKELADEQTKLDEMKQQGLKLAPAAE